MNELLLHDGGLLFVDGGLTTDPNCCYYCEPPPPCPPCCVRIDFGTFNSDGDLIGTFPHGELTVGVKIVMPTKDSRVVCDTDQITVEWGITNAGFETTGGFMRFGAGWEYSNPSPALDAEENIIRWGLVDWGPGHESGPYSVTLTFRRCFLDTSFFLFYIDIGLDGFIETIEIARCLTLDRCCPVEIECQDCCAILVLDDVIRYNDRFYKVSESLDGFGGRFTTIVEMTPGTGIVCFGDFLNLKVFFVPPRLDPLNRENRLTINHETWERTSHDPQVDPVDGILDDDFTFWGPLETYEYEISLEAPLCDTCEEVERFEGISIVSDIFPLVEISFFKCDLTDCCPCSVCDEGFANPCCFGQCVPMTERCTRITNYQFIAYNSADDSPHQRFLQTIEDPHQDSGIHLGGCEFRMVYRMSFWDSDIGDWGPEEIVIDPDGFRYRNDGWYDGNAINAPIEGPCCGPVEGGYGPTNSGNPADFYNERYAVVTFEVVNPCDPNCEVEE